MRGLQVKFWVEQILNGEALLHDKQTPPVTHTRAQDKSYELTSYAGS